MATELQLEKYGKLTVKEGTNFPLNFNIQDLTKPESTTSSYSKDIVIVGDKEANKILGQAFDVNISNSVFDINKKVPCNVIQNDANVFENGFFQLLSVTKTGESLPNGDPKVIYKGRVKSKLMNFFTDIKGKDLTDLKLGDSSTYKTLTKQNIENSFNNTVSDIWKFVPLYKVNSPQMYEAKNFKPGIYAKQFFDSIHEDNGWQYDFSELTDVKFDKLIIPYTGEFDADENTKENAKVLADDNTFEQYDFKCKSKFVQGAIGYSNNMYPEFGSGTNKYINCTNTVQDTFNQYDDAVSYGNVSTPEITAAFNADYTYTYEIDFDLVYTNNDTVDIELYGSDNGDQLVVNYFTESQIFDSTAQNALSGPHHSNVGIQVRFDVGHKLAPGNTTVATGKASFTTTVPMNKDEIIRLLIFKEDWLCDGTGNDLFWRPEGNPNQERSVCRILNVNSVDLSIQPELEYNTGIPIYIQDFIPKDIKQRDFIKSIIDMYKLTVDIDPDQDNKLIYKTRDKYYDDGKEVDWRDKIASDKPINLEWLVDKQSKKKKFTYKQDEDTFNKSYFNSVKDIYGEYSFDYSNDFNFGEEKLELIFSPTPIQRNEESDMYLPSLPVGNSDDLNIRILYDGGIRQGYWFLQNDDGTYNSTNNSDYPYFGHFDDPIQPSYDINFGVCEFYFYNTWDLTTNNNLWNLYHRRYTSQLVKGRLMTAYFNLTPTDILNLELNDKIYVDNSWWNINKIIDYNANSDSLTKVELVTVDDGLSITPSFRDNVLEPSPVKPGIVRPTAEYGKYEQYEMNTITKGFVGEVYGEGNIVNGVSSGLVIGDNNTKSGDSIIMGDRSSDGGFNNKLVVGTDKTASEEYDAVIGETKIGKDVNIGETTYGSNIITYEGSVYDNGVYQSGVYDTVSSSVGFGTTYSGGTGSSIYSISADNINISATNVITTQGTLKTEMIRREVTNPPTVTYTISDGHIFMVETNLSSPTITLPTATTGREIIIKDLDGNADVNNITIETPGSETIDDRSNYIIDKEYGYVKLIVYNGNWLVIS